MVFGEIDAWCLRFLDRESCNQKCIVQNDVKMSLNQTELFEIFLAGREGCIEFL